MKILESVLLGCTLGCGNYDAVIDGLNHKIDHLQAQFDRSLTPDAILDLTNVYFLEGTTDESNSSGVLMVEIGGPNGIRGTVCDDYLNTNAANMFCQLLGFNRAANATTSFLPQDGIPILLSDVECDDTSLKSCRSWKLGGGNCRHEHDVFLTCTDGLEAEAIISDDVDYPEDPKGACINDSRFNRVLRGARELHPRTMSPAICQGFCQQNEAKYYGVENGQECFCGNEIFYYQTADPQECDMTCKGNDDQQCGGRDRMNIFLV